jgi:hypothetical protein
LVSASFLAARKYSPSGLCRLDILSRPSIFTGNPRQGMPVKLISPLDHSSGFFIVANGSCDLSSGFRPQPDGHPIATI